jgi:micrococcal nuclease
MDEVNLYTYRARVLRVVDGDTIEVDIDLGYGVLLGKRLLRLSGIDCPEIKTQAGLLAKETTVKWMVENTTTKKLLTNTSSYVTFQSLSDKPDKYGRILAKVIGKDGETLNDYLVKVGHAVPYDGGKRS